MLKFFVWIVCIYLSTQSRVPNSNSYYYEPPIVFAQGKNYFLHRNKYKGSYINDLPSRYGFNELQYLAERWDTPVPTRRADGKLITDCGQEFLGGPGILGGQDVIWRNYSNIAAHASLFITAQLRIIQKWDIQSSFSIIIDDLPPFGPYYPSQIPDERFGYYCTGSTKDLNMPILLRLPHTKTNVSIKFVLDIRGSGSFGVYDLTLAFSTTVGLHTEITLCPGNAFCRTNPPDLSSGGNTCPLGKYWSSSDSICRDCDPACAYCMTSSAICNKCKDGYSWDGFKCTAQPLPSICLIFNFALNKCERCQPGMILDRDGSCVFACKEHSDLVFGETNNHKFCHRRCSEGKYLHYDGYVCTSECLPPLVQNFTQFGAFCEFPCPRAKNSFLLWDGQCEDECQDPLTKVNNGFHFCERCGDTQLTYEDCRCPKFYKWKSINNVFSCSKPCNNIEDYYYLNDTCLNSCNPPFKKKEENGIKICEHPISFETIIDSLKTTIIQEDKWIVADNSFIQINNKTQFLDITWAFIGVEFNNPINYTLYNYETEVNCGCSEMKCGHDCDQGVYCKEQNVRNNCYFPTEKMENFCWNIYIQGEETFQAYNLGITSIISLIDYGGPHIPFSEPGFSVDRQVGSQIYAVNAMITDYEVLEPDLKLVYASSVEKVITLDDLAVFTKEPTIDVNFTGAECTEEHQYLQREIITELPNPSTIGNFYYILKRLDPEDVIVSLEGVRILTHAGTITEWWNQQNMTILDPCNQQALNLIQDPEEKIFYVKPPGHQKLINGEIICIAISGGGQNDKLFLYEIKNKTQVWSPSTRFTGILSNNFIERVKLRITLHSTRVIPYQKDDDEEIKIDVNLYTSPPLLQLRTPRPMDCEVYLSDLCNYKMSTVDSAFNSDMREIDLEVCEDISIGAYNCEGNQGNFFPPSKIQKIPVSEVIPPPIIFEVVEREVFDRPKIDNEMYKGQSHPRSWIRYLKAFFLDWSLVAILIRICIVLFFVAIYFLIKIRKKVQNKDPEEDVKILKTEEISLGNQDKGKKLKIFFSNNP